MPSKLGGAPVVDPLDHTRGHRVHRARVGTAKSTIAAERAAVTNPAFLQPPECGHLSFYTQRRDFEYCEGFQEGHGLWLQKIKTKTSKDHGPGE